jgi:hypothetical protein
VDIFRVKVEKKKRAGRELIYRYEGRLASARQTGKTEGTKTGQV